MLNMQRARVNIDGSISIKVLHGKTAPSSELFCNTSEQGDLHDMSRLRTSSVADVAAFTVRSELNVQRLEYL